MAKIVTAAEANRNFSKLLRDVDRGETVVVTSHGTPVAELVPALDREKAERMEIAKRRLLDDLADQPRWTAPKWSRHELYEDEPYPEISK